MFLLRNMKHYPEIILVTPFLSGALFYESLLFAHLQGLVFNGIAVFNSYH